MLIKTRSLFLKYIVALLWHIYLAHSCQNLGCLQCGISSSIEVCYKCDANFTLNSQGICIYTKCEQWEYLQLYYDDANNIQKRCVSICGETEFSNSISRACENSFQCTKSFALQSSTNQNRFIKFVYYGDEDKFLYLVYDTFLNIIDQQTGAFVRSIPLESGVQALSLTNNKLFLFNTNTKQIYEWIPTNSTMKGYTQIKVGQPKITSTKIIQVLNTDRLIASSFDDSGNNIYFTEISTKIDQQLSFNQITISSSQDHAIFFDTFIIIQQQQQTPSIKVINFDGKNSSSNIVMSQQSFQCNQILGKILQGEQLIIQGNQILFLIFANTKVIYSTINNQCKQNNQDSQPHQMQIIQEDLCQGFTRIVQLLIVSYDTNVIKIFNAQPTLDSQLIQITLSSSIIDFNYLISEKKIYLYVLLSSNIVQLFRVSISCSQNSSLLILQYQQQNQLSLLINNPQNLISLQKKSDSGDLILSLMILVSQDAQIIDNNTDKSVALVKDFQDRIYQNQGQIQKIIYFEKYNFIVSCSLEDGFIAVWKAVDPLFPEFQYGLKKSGQYCKNILELNNAYIVALFSKSIAVFNIFNQLQMVNYDLDPSYFNSIFTDTDYIYLFFNQRAIILDTHFEIVAQSNLSDNPQQFNDLQVLFVTQKRELITLTQNNLISKYIIDIPNKSIGSRATLTYTSQQTIVYINFFDMLNAETEIIYSDSLSNFYFLNDNLAIQNQIQINFGSTIYSRKVNEHLFIIGFKLNNAQSIYQYTSVIFNAETNFYLQLGEYNQFLGYSLAKNKVNNLGQDIIQLIFMQPIGYSSLIIQIEYRTSYKQFSEVPYGEFAYSPGQNIISYTTDSKQEFIISGFSSGQLRVFPSYNQPAHTILFDAKSNSKLDQIQFVLESFLLDQYFVVTSVIYCYCLHTNQLQETITFSSVSQQIQNVIASENLQILVAFISTEIIVRDFSQKDKKYTLLFSSNESLLKKINGIFLDENTSELFIYGDGLIKISLQLDQQSAISPKGTLQQDNYQNCIFVTQIVVCLVNNAFYIAYDRQNQYINLFTNLASTGLTAGQIIADTTNRLIYIYSSKIEIYTYTGTYQKTITDILYPIKQFNFYDNNIVILTQPAIFIYLRTTQVFVTVITANGGVLLGNIYIKSLKLIAFYSDYIRYGQVNLFSLETYQSAGQVSSGFDANKIGKVVKTMFDYESSMLNYIDGFGNHQNVLFSTTKTTDNTFAIEEIQQGNQSPPIDYILDFKLNNAYVYNNARIWYQNYNLFTRPMQRVMNLPQIHFFQIQIQGDSSPSFIVTDSSNNIYKYQNSQLTFWNNFNENIIIMKKIEVETQIRFIFVFRTQMLVYNNFNNYFSQDQPYYSLTNYNFKKFLIIMEDKVVFNTITNQIIDYDFFNQKQLFSVSLDLIDDISKTLQVGSKNQSYWYLIYGTQTGKVGCYDLKNFQHQFILQSLSQESAPIIGLKLFSQIDFACVDRLGNIVMIDTKNLIPYANQQIQQVINQKVLEITSKQNILPIQVFKFDLAKERFFINFKQEKFIGVWNLTDYSFIKYLSFPDNEWKQIVNNDKFIIFACSFQLNVYTYDNLQFLNYVRRYNRRDRITDLRMIDTNKIIAVFASRIETLLINSQSKQITLIDSFTLEDAKLLYNIVDPIQRILTYIGVSKDKVFEKKISVGLYESTYQASTQLSCYSKIVYQNFISSQNDFEQMYNPNSLQYLFSVAIQDQIKNLSFLNKDSLSIVLRPFDSSENQLSIQSDSFQSLLFDIKMDGFNLNLSSKQQNIQTNSKTKNIILQDIFIQDQVIHPNTSFYFSFKDTVIFKNFTISNLEINYKFFQSQPQQETPSVSYLFNFISCTNVVFDNFVIDNLQIKKSFSSFINLSKIASIRIKNLKVKNSSFNSLISIFQSQSVIIDSLVIENCSSIIQDIAPEQLVYVINLIGNINMQINGMIVQNNQNMQILQTDKSYTQDDGVISLSIDQLNIQGGQFFNNTFPLAAQSIDIQNNLIQLRTTKVNFNSFQFLNNEGNIQLFQNKQIQIVDCTFKFNLGVDGGALQVSQLKNMLKIVNSVFQNNKASASGGSILLKEVLNFDIDSNSSITNNEAAIGGGIRIVNSNILQWRYYNIECIIQQNNAEIYGNNIGTIPSDIIIYAQKDINGDYITNITSISTSNIIYSGQLDALDAQKQVIFEQVQSGGLLPFSIRLVDNESKVLFLNETKYLNNLYPKIIIEELNTYFIEVSINQNSSLQGTNNTIELKGESLIGVKQYSQLTEMFHFQSLTLTSHPLSEINFLRIKIFFNFIDFSQYIPTKILFRNCRQGEIFAIQDLKYSFSSNKDDSDQLISCTKCSPGTYLLADASNQYQSYLINKDKSYISSQVCKKCPAKVSYCEGNSLILESGYWRSSNNSDEILECNSIRPKICNEQDPLSINGCIEGYMGPLCEQCDTKGSIWGNRYSHSFSDYSCSQCSDSKYQKIFIVLAIIFLFSYLFISIFFFMGRYMYESRCCYLRLMKLLPFSKSCILDQSSYYIKILLSYLQLSSILYSFSINIIPNTISLIPNTTGQPISKLAINTQCLFSVENLEHYGEERILIVSQALLPVVTFLFFFIMLFIFRKYKIWEVGYYHKYTMINVIFLFFQPDCLSFFTKALSCRKIGSNKYQFVNILLSCDDRSYRTFSYSFVIPNLIFWALTPAVILYFLRLQKGSNNERLNYCISKYKFGYFYLEFRPVFYFWEFVRIYFKIIIILITALMNDLETEQQILCIIIIFFYIILTIRFKPFQSRFLFRLEIITYQLLIPNIFFQLLYQKYPYPIFQAIMAFIHYGFIGYMLIIIMKFKLHSTQNRFSNVFRYIFTRFCFRSIYAKVIKNSQNSRALIRWRKIYCNLAKLKAEYISNQAIFLQQKAQQNAKDTQRNKQYLNSTEFQSLMTRLRSGTAPQRYKEIISQDLDNNNNNTNNKNENPDNKFLNKIKDAVSIKNPHQPTYFSKQKQKEIQKRNKFDFNISLNQLNEVNSEANSQNIEDPFSQDLKNVLSSETVINSTQQRTPHINFIPDENQSLHTFNESIAFKSPKNRFLLSFKSQSNTENK